MKTWSVLYLLIWLALVQILIILFPVLAISQTYDLHALVGLAVVAVALYAYSGVRKTSCPDRIKRITKTTVILGVVQGLLGLVLYDSVTTGLGGSEFRTAILFLHAVNALAIITQASSSATAFDMWEEKEFLGTQQPGP